LRGVELKALVDALNGLIKIVRTEFPEACPLSEIAAIWGEGITPAEAFALGELDAGAEEFVSRHLPDGAQIVEIDGP
jgi:hypothetical protein